jgi:long-chain acyl-CoA synthetase
VAGISNLARLAEGAFERTGDYESLLFEGRWHRSGELYERSCRIATGLTGLGVAPYTGDTTGRAKGVMLSHANLYFSGHAAPDPFDEGPPGGTG